MANAMITTEHAIKWNVDRAREHLVAILRLLENENVQAYQGADEVAAVRGAVERMWKLLPAALVARWEKRASGRCPPG